ncbi:hypothetical protein [Undibacterium umbellatum]|uniref:Uncharacterized protein n=1 Tax=Undibacterium umbellatum TaxID=2762300 RepID=A0ABR6Z5V9_9BURK|nr:hypothetical protein [Undibacterium umbellatum]MBC3907155.1 hypothetical protein [Undibacterium umbellatum]
MTTNRINYINTALIIFSCFVAFVIPFELFLFSYAVLGPLHYLTEIGWLHKKNYFTKGKYDFIFLIGLCFFLLFVPAFLHLSKDSTFAANLVALAVFLSIIFVLVEDSLYRIALVVLALLAVGLDNKSPDYLIWIGLFLPTIIHVFIFTLAFMLFGALKEKVALGVFVHRGFDHLCGKFFSYQARGLAVCSQ